MDNNTNSRGPVIGTIIVVIILVLGAIYFIWNKNAVKVDGGANATPAENSLPADGTTSVSPATSSNPNDLQTIESELNATDLGSLDTDLNDLESELGKF